MWKNQLHVQKRYSILFIQKNFFLKVYRFFSLKFVLLSILFYWNSFSFSFFFLNNGKGKVICFSTNLSFFWIFYSIIFWTLFFFLLNSLFFIYFCSKFDCKRFSICFLKIEKNRFVSVSSGNIDIGLTHYVTFFEKKSFFDLYAIFDAYIVWVKWMVLISAGKLFFW